MKFQSITNLCSTALSVSIICCLSTAQAQPMDPSATPTAPNITPQVVPLDPAPATPPVQSSPQQVPNVPNETAGTSISCNNSGGTFTTVAEQGSNRAVLFTWKTTEFGPEFTPEKRCQIVSEKFDNFVRENGGGFENLSLTTDVVNGYPVICMNRPGAGSCSVLFTLKKENRRQAQAIITSLLDPGVSGSSGINEARKPVVKLSEWSKRKLSARKVNAPASVKKPTVRKGGFR
jgi:Circadian oscillating protein COP23